ncbi:MAG: type I secretion C-terminal target domain-containing protein [Pseudomonadota bacterium]
MVTSVGDTIFGTGSKETLKGGLLNDKIYGRGGADKLIGGDGNDTLFGEAGADDLVGGNGNDVLLGGDDADTLTGSDGNDKLQGETGADLLIGGSGMDTLLGGDGNDVLRGGDGDDVMRGASGNDTLRAGAGQDQLFGGVGADALFGEGGDDRLLGAAGKDNLQGGDGNDELRGGADDDDLNGGNGNDLLFGDAGNDDLVGADGNDLMKGGNGNDDLNGGNGNDDMWGGAGNDTLVAGNGDDTVVGGTGNDIMTGNAGADHFVLKGGFDTITDFDLSEGDTLDIGALITGWKPATSDLRDYVRFDYDYGTRQATLMVDANGAAQGENFKSAGVLKATRITHIDEMLVAGAITVNGKEVSGDDYRDPQPEGERAHVASFIDFLGVGARIPNEVPFGDVDVFIDSMDYINVSHVRAPSPAHTTDYIVDAYVEAAQAGIDFNFRARNDFPDGGQKLLNDYVKFYKDFLKKAPGGISSIEGLNEVGSSVSPFTGDGWEKGATNYQKQLYQTLNSDPLLKDIPIYNFTVHFGRESENFEGLGDLDPYSDNANAHVYINTSTRPYYELKNRLENVQLINDDDPVVMTELGYTTAKSPGYSIAVDEKTQAKLLLNMLMDSYAQGVERVFIYELFDEKGPKTDVSANFGLFRTDGSAKPSAHALHNLTEILGDGAGAANAKNQTFSYDIEGDDQHTHSLSMRKSDGSAVVILWQEELIWDRKAFKPINADPVSVELELTKNYNKIQIFDPIEGKSAISTRWNTDSVSVELTDHPLIIEIDNAYL